VDCFNIFMGCISVINNNMVITQGSEQLATASAICFLSTFSHLFIRDPRSSAIKDIRHHYRKVFQNWPRFNGLPSFYTFRTIHSVFYPHDRDWSFSLRDSRLPNHEHILCSRAQVKIARTRDSPDWTFGFVLHSLFLDPLPSISVIVDCLSIIAMKLGCNVTTHRTVILNKRYVYIQHTLITLTPTQCTGG